MSVYCCDEAHHFKAYFSLQVTYITEKASSYFVDFSYSKTTSDMRCIPFSHFRNKLYSQGQRVPVTRQISHNRIGESKMRMKGDTKEATLATKSIRVKSGEVNDSSTGG